MSEPTDDRRELTVVMSGFDHYDGVAVNPALEVPRMLAAEPIDVDGVTVRVHPVALPVSFANAWPELRAAIDATHPDIVIATGLKHEARGVMLERCATNLMDASTPDADNATPRREPIDPSGPAAYWTRLPLRSILKDFAGDGIPASLSSDAGTFVCNSLFYSLLAWTSTQDRVLSGFVSLPCVAAGERRADDSASPAAPATSSAPAAVPSPAASRGLTLERLTEAVRDVVRETVRYHLAPSAGDVVLV
ncbi:pyroglutamyl-peptidase I [Bifidobacterium samirii]|uniref:Pyroglutamyl-peptidase I n=1 Tax=Bifidobacterium samirii TaxID=2306974 RepID=A0A430FRA9_9BIFI|nr:pyroglutamyl-peptidase I [Bifidobacterium samirii]RSX55395.1 peptidase C15 [Bifidobacterium samirii]